METISRLSVSSSMASYIDDSAQSTTDDSAAPSRPSDASCPPDFRTSTPASWYAALASEPPRAQDFIIYDDEEGDFPHSSASKSVSQCSDNTIVISEKLPSEEQLDAAGNLPIYDGESTKMPFRSLFTGEEHEGSRQLIIFIRHFYCGACRDYVKTLAGSLPKSKSADIRDTRISLITCCAPRLIKKYEAVMGTNFKLYTDPRQRLFKAMGCKRYALSFGRKKPKYAHSNLVKTVLGTFREMGVSGKDGFAGGSLLQIGGEFLFEEGRPVWCHRMTNMRDHSEVDVIKQVLRTDDKYDIYTIDDNLEEEDDGSTACTTSSGACDTTFDMTEFHRATAEFDERREASALHDLYEEDGGEGEGEDAVHRPTALRRVTEEYSDDDRSRNRERPSCVPGIRPEDRDVEGSDAGSRYAT